MSAIPGSKSHLVDTFGQWLSQGGFWYSTIPPWLKTKLLL